MDRKDCTGPGMPSCCMGGRFKSVQSPSLFAQQIINGIQLGFVYALIALGYTMVYGIVKLINFAHGDVFYGRGFRKLLRSQPMVITYVAVCNFSRNFHGYFSGIGNNHCSYTFNGNLCTPGGSDRKGCL